MRLTNAIVRNLEEQARRRRGAPENRRLTLMLRVLAILCLVAVAQFFVSQLAVFLDWPPAAYRRPEVLNLTTERVVWDVYYGRPVACGATDCHLTADHPSSAFTKTMVLPAREFPLTGYESGQTIYYRTRVVLPERVRAGGGLLVFHSVYVWAKRYELYVNGQLIDTGGERLISAAIPPALVGGDGVLHIAFKIDPGRLAYQGLAHHGELVVGPQELIQPLEYAARDIKTVYYLIYIIPRLTLAIVFALLFLTMSRKVENGIFAVFAVVSSASLVALSNLKGLRIDAEPMPVHMLLTCWTSWLFLIVAHMYFRRVNRVFPWAMGAAAAYLAWLSQSLLEGWRPGAELAIKTMFTLRFAGYGYALFLAVTTAVYLQVSGKSPHRLMSALVVAVFMSLCVVFHSADALGLVPLRYTQITSLTIDTLLMILMAGLMSFEFRHTVVEKDFIHQTFRSHVDARVADHVLQDRAILQPQERVITVMFSDIRAFTALAERHAPGEVFAFLNRYFGIMVEVINAHGGTIDKFGGDSIMAVWGAPVPDADHAGNAVRCGVAMRDALAAFNAGRARTGEAPVVIGIGLHTGPVISGTLGTAARAEYTVIGDTVNTAARLESLTKDLETDLLVSEATLKLAGDAAVFEAAGNFAIKGKTHTVAVYRIAAGPAARAA